MSSADGVPIHYRSEGSGGLALVFVHGWACDSTYWDAQVRYFSPQYRVVTLDLAGHGLSGRERRAWTVAAFAEDVRAVVEELDLERVVLLGHSMSGPVTLEAARMMPERVVALLPVDTLQDAEERYDPEEARAEIEKMRQDFKARTEEFVHDMFPEDADPQLVERVAKDMASAPADIAVSIIEEVYDHDSRQAMSATHVPIRAIMSERYPAKLEINRRYAPQFEAVTVLGTGHYPMLESPGEFNRLVAEALEAVTTGAASPAQPTEEPARDSM